MSIIGFLSYPDFLAELVQDSQPKPLRLQAYNRNQQLKPQPLKQFTFLVDLSTENLDGDIILCRFITATCQVLITRTGDSWQFLDEDKTRLTRLTRRNDHAADLLKKDLVHCGFHVSPGLIQLTEDVSIETAWPACWDDLNKAPPPVGGAEGGQAK